MKIPAPAELVLPGLHFWNLAIHLTALAYCIRVEVLLERKLEIAQDTLTWFLDTQKKRPGQLLS